MAAVALIIAWAVTGPFFHFSDGERGAVMAAGNDSGQQAPPNQNTPATGSATNSGPSVGAQSTGAYPGATGPTGSTQPDATNPVRSNPSGGGTSR